MKTSEIRPASDGEIDAFFAYAPWTSHVRYAEVLIESDMMMAMGSEAIYLGRRFVFLDIREGAEAHRFSIVRGLRRWLADQTGRIYVVCNRDHKQAPALLTRLGFEPTGLMMHGREVWEWNSQH